MKERLDRCLGNNELIVALPHAQVFNLPIVGSDHRPLLFDSHPTETHSPKIFRFEHIWTSAASCEQIITSAWVSASSTLAMPIWIANLKACQKSLSSWSLHHFPNSHKQVDILLSQLNHLHSNPIPDAGTQICSITKRIEELWVLEEQFWHQRSRVSWLKLGDQNTNFFHQSATKNRQRNRILRLRNSHGQWMDSDASIAATFLSYYQQLYTSVGPRDLDDILLLIDPVVTTSMNDCLSTPVTLVEVKQAILGLGSLKAPGPDGFPGLFHQTYWHSVNKVIHEATVSFFQTGQLLQEINKTHLVLLPKVAHPEHAFQFRPIGLCNFSYKILSKIMANRLKPFMPDLISENQAAFVVGRQIQDNVVIAHEMFHHLKLLKQSSMGAFGLKLDISKAYDSVEWDFLQAVLFALEFQPHWIMLIINCVRSVTLSILVNGKPSPYFTPTRGIRQGDPLSPYLFLFVSDVLSTLQINYSKSTLFFSPNTDSALVQTLSTLFGISSVTNPGKYLGLPTVWGRSKVSALAYVRESINRKLTGWNSGSLTQAGKEILIKSIAMAVPAYPMMCFRFPKSICRKINSLIAQFWWGNKGESGIHWLRWSALGCPKSQGGMGFRSLEDFNQALLAKQGWRLLTNPTALWVRVLKARYFSTTNFFDARKGSSPSWLWSSLLHGRELLHRHVAWQIGNGTDIPVWNTNWIPHLPGMRLTPHSSVDLKMTVDSLINWNTHSWDISAIGGSIAPSQCQAIQAIPLISPHKINKMIWPLTKTGNVLCTQAPTSLEAEALALRVGVLLARTMTASHFILETDSLQLVNMLSHSNPSTDWAVQPLVEHIQALTIDMGSHSWEWTSRLANQAADHMASLVRQSKCPTDWF
ncbi:hypothetical protein ACLB2K_011409 [Fragaria x ananassa]